MAQLHQQEPLAFSQNVIANSGRRAESPAAKLLDLDIPVIGT